MTNRYYSGHSDWQELLTNFYEKDIPEPDIIFADYDGYYDGQSTVVFKKDDKWYLDDSSHCSCYGLEGQWSPEEFDPQIHFKALEEGKRYITFYDNKTNKYFDEWFKEVSK